MSSSTSQTEPTLIDRYQAYRTRRFLKHERTYSKALPAVANRSSAQGVGRRRWR